MYENFKEEKIMLNKAILIGRLTHEVDIEKTAGGTPKAKFSIAVSRNYKPKGKDKPETDFFNVVAWNSTAEFVAKHFQKGKQVYVVGSIETYSYETENGKRYGFNIKADEVGFADAKSGGNNADNQGGNAGQPQNGDMSPFPDDFGQMPENFAPVPGDFEDDDLPF